MNVTRICRLLTVPVVGIVLAATATANASPITTNQTASQIQQYGRSGPYSLKYVALGDSMAAGLGYAPVAGASEEDKVCGRSTEAYAYDVAAGVNATLSKVGLSMSVANASCQGATTSNLLQSQTLSNTVMEPQLDKAFAGVTPTLLTLTSGANDAQWARFVGTCFSPINCDTPENTAALQANIATMKQDMRSAMRSIKARSLFVPPIVVATGYYNPISPQCVSNNLTGGEVEWLETATASLNEAIHSSTQDAYWFARFAPVNFEGHDICSSDPWIQRPSGLPGELAPFHPTPRGQEEIAKSILQSIGIRQ